MKKRNIVISILLVLTLVTLAFTSKGTFAWYKFDDAETVEGAMGIVEADVINGRLYPTYGEGSGEKVSLTKEYTIENKSNIDAFIRIGYTVVYGDSYGGEVLINTSNASMISSFIRSAAGTPITTFVKDDVPTLGGATKQYTYPMSYSANFQRYLRLKPGENLNCSLVISGVDTSIQMPDVVVTAESIQATKKALVEAVQYGWDTRYWDYQ